MDGVKTIYAPVNLMAPCTMVFMQASPLREVLGPGTLFVGEIAQAVR